MYRIEIECNQTDKDGFEHVIVRGITLDGDVRIEGAMQSVKTMLYTGHSVYERMPLEIERKMDFTTKRKHLGAYLRFYRKPGDEWVRQIDRALGKTVETAHFAMSQAFPFVT